MKLYLSRTTAFMAACLAMMFGGNVHAAACEDPNPLRFSMAPRVNFASLLEEYRPLLLQLEQSLGRKIHIVVPSSYNGTVQELLAGNIDLASLGPASYLIARAADPGITPFATWTLQGGTYTEAGSASYYALLVVRKDSGISSIADLRGKSLGLSDPVSTSGALIPRSEFGKRIRQPLENYFGKISYSGSHDRAINALLKGYVEAAFVASQRLDDAIRKGLLSPNDIVLLWKSRPIPRDPFVMHSKLCPALQEKIRQAFLGGHDLDASRRSMKAENYIAVEDSDYQALREVLAIPASTPAQTR